MGWVTGGVEKARYGQGRGAVCSGGAGRRGRGSTPMDGNSHTAGWGGTGGGHGGSVLEGNRTKCCKAAVEEFVEGDGEVSAQGIRVCVEGNRGCEHMYRGIKGTWGHVGEQRGHGGVKGTWGCVAWKGGTPSHTERSIVLDKNSVSWRRAEKVLWELSTWGALFGVRLCAMVSEGMWSPNRGFQGAAGGTGVWEEDGVRSESCQLSPRSLGSPHARHPRGDAPGQENPGRCGSLWLPRQQRRGAAISAVPARRRRRLRWT